MVLKASSVYRKIGIPIYNVRHDWKIRKGDKKTFRRMNGNIFVNYLKKMMIDVS